jgi:Domain of unknown function (DUF6471)
MNITALLIGVAAGTDWADRVKRYLKAELKRADVTYEELAARLGKLGLDESEVSVANKLSRSTFPATFFMAAVKAIGLEEIKMRDL